MNNQRRKELRDIASRIEMINCELSDLAMEEQDAFDNMPESIQYTERGEAMEENVSELEELAAEASDLEGRIIEIVEK
jgi:hypothetical protein